MKQTGLHNMLQRSMLTFKHEDMLNEGILLTFMRGTENKLCHVSE